MKKFLNEFKEFALKGNALELAIGVIIGGAFNQIVTSLVNDIIMPVFGLIIGNDIAKNAIELVPAKGDAKAVLLSWGSFLQSVINFVIIALTIFVFIKVISSFNKKRVEEEVVEEVAAPSEEVVLLQDILSELKKK
ncbi:large conductance mechanosensitive channel protein MscL [Erysipelothrix sp. HDW6A]|uniref:large conductance mechanosensitive channel protein MscL n=1 Tax=Erysipelothrix sp. HDW6A TaxID=2714928 RepID=UPI0014084C46|nr:large conductance mechanosensitive channel protein MscL [Erysipelothrix sp. HDW6A]QIK57552.1 large conductance mechanosensitive channel protein MscL [Erysipelothrix sp. HDW6A]